VSVGEFAGINFQPIWRLLDTSGAPAGPCGSFQFGSAVCGNPSTGDPFRIEVIDSGLDATGDYILSIGCDPTDTGEHRLPLPTELALHPNRPNPFNPTTSFRFDLPAAAHVLLEVLDLAGRRVATVVDRDMPAGRHQIAWSAADLPSGLYIYRLRSNGIERSRKLMVLK
jgi:hypothetical protein